MLGNGFDEGSPIFLQIKERIEDQIIQGALNENDQIPSTTQIVQFYKINHLTVSKGVNLLVDEGILYKKRGVGMFVKVGAKEVLLKNRKEKFFKQFIKPMVSEAKKLNITTSDLMLLINECK